MSLQRSPSQPMGLEQLVQNAPFPLYGLCETPDDHILHGIGYSLASVDWDTSAGRNAPPPFDGPKSLWTPEMWVEVRAYGWMQQDIFGALVHTPTRQP
jgi:hypothetical protein